MYHRPGLRTPAAGRELSGILGASQYSVSFLKVSDTENLVEKFRQYQSIHLFEERAQLVQMDFSLGETVCPC